MACKEYPLCKYALYEVQPNKLEVLKCRKSNELCAHSKYCSRMLKVIHTSTYISCALRKQ